jgi:hypothetical protein
VRSHREGDCNHRVHRRLSHMGSRLWVGGGIVDSWRKHLSGRHPGFICGLQDRTMFHECLLWRWELIRDLRLGYLLTTDALRATWCPVDSCTLLASENDKSHSLYVSSPQPVDRRSPGVAH